MGVLGLIVAGKLALYWLCIYVFFHRIPFNRQAELPHGARALIPAGIRVTLGLLLGIPLGAALIGSEEWIILMSFGAVRLGAWLVSVWRYHRIVPGAPVLFALLMTGLNFTADLAIFGTWLPKIVSDFSI
ncbi:MAG TPA: hypothetical protein VI643_02360 [Planctomycetota bacterium]|nr:hypothetical protein [Planctomycetota bacterium]